jgi:hypothetical protein
MDGCMMGGLVGKWKEGWVDRWIDSAQVNA